MLTRNASTRERGASAIIVAAALLLLLGFAAIATDVGAGFGERRQSQNAADVSVVAGTLWSTISPSANPLQDAVDQAKLVAAANTDTPLTWSSVAIQAPCTGPRTIPHC